MVVMRWWRPVALAGLIGCGGTGEDAVNEPLPPATDTAVEVETGGPRLTDSAVDTAGPTSCEAIPLVVGPFASDEPAWRSQYVRPAENTPLGAWIVDEEFTADGRLLSRTTRSGDVEWGERRSYLPLDWRLERVIQYYRVRDFYGIEGNYTWDGTEAEYLAYDIAGAGPDQYTRSPQRDDFGDPVIGTEPRRYREDGLVLSIGERADGHPVIETRYVDETSWQMSQEIYWFQGRTEAESEALGTSYAWDCLTATLSGGGSAWQGWLGGPLSVVRTRTYHPSGRVLSEERDDSAVGQTTTMLQWHYLDGTWRISDVVTTDLVTGTRFHERRTWTALP